MPSSRSSAEAPGGVGVAGRAGDGVRSELRVVVRTDGAGAGGIEISSKVEALYGSALRREVEETLERLGVFGARVEVEDRGALPWVVEARTEAAARRAGVGDGGDARPPRTAPVGARTARDRPRRSRLYLPGNEPKFMINAGLHGADGIILDLEDSVHPDEKDAARILVRNALRAVDFGGAERMVRINPLPRGTDDLAAVIPEDPDVVLIPKAESADAVREVHARTEELRDAAGIDEPVWLMPILESALGVERAHAIASAEPTVVAVTIGLEDYTADLGVPKTPEGEESVYARRRLVNAARAAGVQAIDSVYGDVEDVDGLRAWARRARAMGFEGMGCIHPRQIRTIHEAFAPSEDEVERAMRIVDAYEEAEASGAAVVTLGSRMIDRPVVVRARSVVELARRAGIVDDGEEG